MQFVTVADQRKRRDSFARQRKIPKESVPVPTRTESDGPRRVLPENAIASTVSADQPAIPIEYSRDGAIESRATDTV